MTLHVSFSDNKNDKNIHVLPLVLEAVGGLVQESWVLSLEGWAWVVEGERG